MQELAKFVFKVNVILNRLENCMSFNISNKLVCIDCFQLLGFPLDSLVKNLGKVNFKYLSQKFDGNVIDLIEQK